MSKTTPDGKRKMLVRVIVGAVYFVAVVGCLYAGIVPTCIAVATMGFMCAYELLHLCKDAGRMPNDLIVLVATALYPLAPIVPFDDMAMVTTVLMLIACAVWYVSVPRSSIIDVAITVFIPIYCGFAFSAVSLIRSVDPGMQGFLLTFGVMGCIWLNDTMAYFVGSRFGTRKLAPRISPNKSWEGFWGGIAACVFIWILLALLHVQGLKLLYAIPCGLLVGGAAVLGDLFESRIKRGFGVKDSGNLMPGHGGMLDRSDALLFGCMTAFLLLRIGGVI